MRCHYGTEGCRDTSDRAHTCPPRRPALDASGRLLCGRCGQPTPSTIGGVCWPCYPAMERERIFIHTPSMHTEAA